MLFSGKHVQITRTPVNLFRILPICPFIGKASRRATGGTTGKNPSRGLLRGKILEHFDKYGDILECFILLLNADQPLIMERAPSKNFPQSVFMVYNG